MLGLRAMFSLVLAVAAFATATTGFATEEQASGQTLLAPINAVFPPAGEAIRKDLGATAPAESIWTLKGWVRIDSQSDQPRIVAAIISKSGTTLAELGLIKGQVFVVGAGASASARALAPARGKVGDWLLVTLSSAGEGLALSVDQGKPVKVGNRLADAPATLILAPRTGAMRPYQGAVANFTMWQGTEAQAPQTVWAEPDEELIQFENGSRTWPLQVKQYMGLTEPQDPATLPVSRAAEQAKAATIRPKPTPALTQTASGRWTVGAWHFAAEPEVAATPEEISKPGFDGSLWLPATVPGTVLTSYIDNGVYPDPAYGLNNLLIPERLSRQDYWYRTEFELPGGGGHNHQSIQFEGINYASEIWVNGERLGTVEGAFIRGRFTIPDRFRHGQRVAVAVRVSPPPHPGLPHEESLKGGPGPNGGEMTIDGPTFGASQGWDWIPTVRDRNTGIWQDIVLEATGPARLGDPHVRTVLPKPDNSLAEITIEVPVVNDSTVAAQVIVEARFGEAELRQAVVVEPSGTAVARFAPGQFAQLRLENPKLWWPNGYGEPVLHRLALTAIVNGVLSDSREIRFGMREVSYELSLVDRAEELQRVSVSPARSNGEQLLDVRHQKIRKVEGGWAVSLARDISSSPALASAPPTQLAPDLLLKVNGVPIAVRGGNWGMDDWLKRVSRERLEPYFRLHREANVNTIRNWMGQNTEAAFFDLADEYGLLVINDFWISTQDHNGEPGDTALFLKNAADTISRFRHHPSIALWIGRNEGVPPPVLNTSLERLVREIDGTRAYLPNSRDVHLANSGPWNYQQPENYFTKHAIGFSTEVGTPSFPTLETFKAMMPEADQWPISDSWAYHDWHQGKAGDVANFMRAMNARFGAPEDLAAFEMRAQLLNYESHRAIFEGMNDGLFVRNSGRLLWMTHPAWPSTAWQIYSHDYDTQASYFGTKKGSEPIHVQLNLPDNSVAIVNSLADPIANARLRIRNFDLGGTLLSDRVIRTNAPAYATTNGEIAVPDSLFGKSSVILSKLELFDASDRLLSENLYWLAPTPAAYRAMTTMHSARVSVKATIASGEVETEIRVTLQNESSHPALMAKLSLLDASGNRILPAYWSDNYVSLLPGEIRTVTIKSPKAGPEPSLISIGGWNVEANSTAILP